jgi:lantibiotic modifying enzyme
VQQEPVLSDNRKIRLIVRNWLINEFNLKDSVFSAEDLVCIIEDYFLPSLVYYYYLSDKKEFTEFLNTINIKGSDFIQIFRRIEKFLKEINYSKTNGKEKIKILGDIHPYSSTKFLSEGKVIYHSYPDYNESLHIVTKEVINDYYQYFPKIKKENGTFIREFIEIHKNTTDRKQIEKYYYNLGKFIPILLFLRAIDINAENMIVNLPYPKFFDMESIFSGTFEKDYENYGIKNTGVIKIDDDKDSSILTGGLKIKESLLKPIISGTNKEPIIRWRIKSKGKFNNIPLLNSKVVNPMQFLQDLVSGYEESVNTILERKEYISTLLKNTNTYTRVILRPTRMYRSLVLRSCYPQIYTEIKTEEFLKENLQNYSYIYSIEDCSVLENEVESLEKLVIPVFYSSIHQKEIIAPNNKVVAYWRESPYNCWKRFLYDTLNQDYYDKQLSLIKSSLYK